MKFVYYAAIGLAIKIVTISACIYGGIAYEKHQIAKVAGNPLSAIAIMECNELEGFIYVTHDGKVHAAPAGIPVSQLEALANELPESNQIAAILPCHKQDTIT